MDVVTAAKMREIDLQATSDYGIPSVVLMENAGLRVVEVIRQTESGANIVIVAGRGNNGGDGFVAARHLFQEKNVSVWTTASLNEYEGDAFVNLSILQKLGIFHRNLREEGALAALAAALHQADLVVDALLGTGITRDVDSFYAAIITLINAGKAPVLSVDIPSGVCADTGKIRNIAVQANMTITFGLPKQGLLLFPGAAFTGRLEVAQIGIPPALLTGSPCTLLTAATVGSFIPHRPADAHKGTFGTVLLVGGSLGMSGALTLAARAALRGGCGLLLAATPRSAQHIVAAQVTEAITIPLPESSSGYLQREALDILREKWSSCQAMAVGPGLTQNEEILPVLSGVLSEFPLPVVLDADALNLLAAHPGLLADRRAPVILTPHPGEAARLLSCGIAEIQADRLGAVREMAKIFRSVVVLKGAHSLICSPDGETSFNVTGNSGMATAGCGDVLTGLLAALIAQGVDAVGAARLGVYLHGLAGDLAVRFSGQSALLASDVIEQISQAYLETAKNTY
ncbi:MAG: Bifunctional NAD(P)H-hydrate repair enzyme Nnr [Dehalococcoidia bacterium]|nr:Bifunctional NAD(P)H-hydrate repair enzyme Nnr [Bacillota bacterium]MBT9142880.1 Bifunctional NAD(P)H-hydrate repair enzyme Nnr [Bacillota bacterium]